VLLYEFHCHYKIFIVQILIKTVSAFLIV